MKSEIKRTIVVLGDVCSESGENNDGGSVFVECYPVADVVS